jgi:hypothetical protein
MLLSQRGVQAVWSLPCTHLGLKFRDENGVPNLDPLVLYRPDLSWKVATVVKGELVVFIVIGVFLT